MALDLPRPRMALASVSFTPSIHSMTSGTQGFSKFFHCFGGKTDLGNSDCNHQKYGLPGGGPIDLSFSRLLSTESQANCGQPKNKAEEYMHHELKSSEVAEIILVSS